MAVFLIRPCKLTHIIITVSNKRRVIEASEVHQAMNFKELLPVIEQTCIGAHGIPQRNVFCLEEGTDHGDGFAVLPA